MFCFFFISLENHLIGGTMNTQPNHFVLLSDEDKILFEDVCKLSIKFPEIIEPKDFLLLSQYQFKNKIPLKLFRNLKTIHNKQKEINSLATKLKK
jgi:hypothetical protein